jgi:hypothetical protein
MAMGLPPATSTLRLFYQNYYKNCRRDRWQALNPLVVLYDIHGKKRKALFFQTETQRRSLITFMLFYKLPKPYHTLPY